jgi:hypothetical protein
MIFLRYEQETSMARAVNAQIIDKQGDKKLVRENRNGQSVDEIGQEQ